MKQTRECAFCGREFSARSGSQRYCCEECAEKAKKKKKDRQRDFLKATEPMMDIQGAEYLSFSKAAILMGCSRQYIYKIVAEKKLPASRISSRMSFIRRTDIEAMLAGNPYHRVLLGSRHKERAQSITAESSGIKMSASTDSRDVIGGITRTANTTGKEHTSSLPSCSAKSFSRTDTPHDEVLDYISGEDVMTTYKVKRSWLYTSAKKNQIPMCKIAGVNYYSRKHLDDLFGVSAEVEALTEWLTPMEAVELYGTTREALRTHVYRRHIPTKREYGQTYYSKKHLDELFRLDLVNNDDYYTVEQVQARYGYTKANICHIVKVSHITKVKFGVKNLLLKTDVDRVMKAKEEARDAMRVNAEEHVKEE